MDGVNFDWNFPLRKCGAFSKVAFFNLNQHLFRSALIIPKTKIQNFPPEWSPFPIALIIVEAFLYRIC